MSKNDYVFVCVCGPVSSFCEQIWKKEKLTDWVINWTPTNNKRYVAFHLFHLRGSIEQSVS